MMRSGQVKVFNVHIQNKVLWRTPVMGTGISLRRFLSGTGKKGREYKGVQAVRPESVAGGRWFEVLWSFELHRP